jgi:hypothetical protein
MGEHYHRTRTFRRFPTISDGIIHPSDGTVGITSPGNYAIPSPERNSVEQWWRPLCRDASPLICHRIVGTAPCLPGLSCPAPDDEFQSPSKLRARAEGLDFHGRSSRASAQSRSRKLRRTRTARGCLARHYPKHQLGPSPPQTSENPVRFRCAVHWDPRPRTCLRSRHRWPCCEVPPLRSSSAPTHL